MKNKGLLVLTITIGMLMIIGSVGQAQNQRVEAWEKRINEERQPPKDMVSPDPVLCSL